MDAQGSGSGFDAALKALEDLETDVAQARETSPAPAVIEAAIEPAIEAAAEPSVTTGSIDAIAPIELGFAADDALETEIVAEAPAPAPAPVPHAPKPVEIAVTAVEPKPVAIAEEGEPASVATPAPAGHAAEPAAPKRSKLVTIAVGLGLFSSIVSAAGLVVVSRTVVSASLVVADARERAAEMKKVGTLVHELETIRARQQILLQRQEAAAAVAPVTSQDLDQRFGELREGLVARDQSKAMLDLVHDGQSQLNETMGAIGAKISRIETKIDAKH
jgi:hypothetical protein